MDQAFLADFETEIWELSACLPHEENPRRHPKKGKPKWEALRKSLQFDYFDPMVVNRRNGNAELLAWHVAWMEQLATT